MTVKDAYLYGLAPQEIEHILAHILKMSREYVLAHPEQELTKEQQKLFEQMAEKRKKGLPLAYVLGNKEFYGLEFAVDQNVLIPRPETELMVDEALQAFQKFLPIKNKTVVIDLGTGSGCIMIALVTALMQKKLLNEKVADHLVEFFAVDISSAALAVAEKNCQTHGLQNIIRFVQSDLLDFVFVDNSMIKARALTQRLTDAGTNFLIMANLPYLSQTLYQSAEKSVKDFEPELALVSGEDGLDHYRRLFRQIKQGCQSQPAVKFQLLLEISPEQKQIIIFMAKAEFPKAQVDVLDDLAGKARLCKILIDQ